jgi:hypothetical protein
VERLSKDSKERVEEALLLREQVGVGWVDLYNNSSI